MEEECRIFLIGDSLFTESLAQMLAAVENIQVMGTAVSPQTALLPLQTAVPHLVIIAHAGSRPPQSADPILNDYPDIPIIYADLNRDYIQVITSRRVSARLDALLATIRALVSESERRSIEPQSIERQSIMED